jgi:hypothetical protein
MRLFKYTLFLQYMQWNIQSQVRYTAQQMRGRYLFSQPASMLHRHVSLHPSYVTRRLYQLVEEAKQDKGRWPLSNQDTPVALVHKEQGSGDENRAECCPIPYLCRNLISETEVLILCILSTGCGGIVLSVSCSPQRSTCCGVPQALLHF